MITPVAFENIKYNTYTIFAIINAFMVPAVYFFFPESAYRSLEEMDSIFQKVSGWRAAFTIVHQAKIEPRRYGKNGELLIRVDEADEKAHAEHQNGGSHDLGGDDPKDASMFASTDEEDQRRAE